MKIRKNPLVRDLLKPDAKNMAEMFMTQTPVYVKEMVNDVIKKLYPLSVKAFEQQQYLKKLNEATSMDEAANVAKTIDILTPEMFDAAVTEVDKFDLPTHEAVFLLVNALNMAANGAGHYLNNQLQQKFDEILKMQAMAKQSRIIH